MTITKKETHSGKTDSLRKQAEKIARKKVAASPENINKMSPAKIKRMIHELRVQQIELDIQNEELRQSKAALEDSRARYFDLYDLAPVGYVTVNEKGLIIEANLTIATLLGIKKSNLAKQLLSRFISEEDQNIYYLQRKKLFDTDALQNCELRMLKKGGMAFWAGLTMTVVLAADGTPVCRIAIADITARKRADEALRESEELATELIATMPDIMVRMTLTGGILFINDVGLRLTEYRAEEMIGHNIFSFIAPEDLDKAARNAVLMLERKLGPQEYHLIMKDGRKVIFEVNAAVLHRKDGSPYEQALICRDITNRKQMEAENAALEAQNRQLQKSESLSRMAASIA
ncbi:MAG: PAS domain S-box protein, partial [Deltaproteobacteria bacterium]